MKRALLMSSSRMGQLGYLEHAEQQLHTLFQHDAEEVLFIPYAAVSFCFDDFESIVKTAFVRYGYGLKSIHRFSDPVTAVKNAKAIAVGGGNTFALLNRLYQSNIVELISLRVNDGELPYVGWSAGSNVATPTIRTTNDMPVVQPPSFQALNIVPFQINPHFISGKPVGHNGESREERLNEFLSINAGEELLALYEGSALYIENQQGRILGEKEGLWFRAPNQIDNIVPNQSFELTMIKGAH
ncbi:dipeptidase PepE [Salmonella enterica]|uniref:Dipeptidase PepE n=1 Tax=Salmonella enterica I TaxID=59201 RepID=A0A3R1AY53_SALET|nr:dipeptidase PepE [Salmonella enterica]EAS0615072.1 dipeptidase PepE [Salmonella enterica subsp. enterica serovar Dahomey]EBQ9004335.1 dipeptidase PepE [Salmonella enterica subsp. enterica serovar Blockley]ECD6161490.1 dipeptidase PepE [Salmonella enterica subsp. enterica]ECU7994758.1 dipeptidase PepE [Salmonella enterica subsp. enterica serovar Toucra]MML55554.1 dipeptidase PepE [Salmonella enterica subsp. enterica serovar Kidderminster]